MVDLVGRVKFLQFLHVNRGPKANPGRYFQSNGHVVCLFVFVLYIRTSHHSIMLCRIFVFHLSSSCFQFLMGTKVGPGQAQSKPHAIAD